MDPFDLLNQDYNDAEYEAELRADIQRAFALGMEVKREAFLEHRLVNALLGRKTWR